MIVSLFNSTGIDEVEKMSKAHQCTVSSDKTDVVFPFKSLEYERPPGKICIVKHLRLIAPEAKSVRGWERGWGVNLSAKNSV